MKDFEVCLSNRDCIFDSATFDDAKEAAEWATGRRGNYVIQGDNGLNVKSSNDNLYVENFYGYEEISEDELVEMIKRYAECRVERRGNADRRTVTIPTVAHKRR